MDDDTQRCDRPPAGWACKRSPGHDGPCAPVMLLDDAPPNQPSARGLTVAPARVVFDYTEGDEHVHVIASCPWVSIDGEWVHYVATDSPGQWRSAPASTVLDIAWEPAS